MKIASIIFATYIAALSVVPCTDGYACSDEETAITASINDSHSEEEEDACSPFCVCTCCATHIQLTYTYDIAFSNLIQNTELITFYVEHTLANKASSIWQPPRIS